MNTIYNILVSDGAVALHFLLTMVLLAVVILRGIQAEMKLRRMATENLDLKRQLCELSDFTSNALQGVRKKADLQRDAICHTVDHLTGASELDTRLLEALYVDQNDDLRGPEVLAVDIVSEPVEPDMSTAESAFVTPDPNHIEPDVSMPLRASMITMAADAEYVADLTDEEGEKVEEDIRERSDIMTRALQQSRR